MGKKIPENLANSTEKSLKNNHKSFWIHSLDFALARFNVA